MEHANARHRAPRQCRGAIPINLPVPTGGCRLGILACRQNKPSVASLAVTAYLGLLSIISLAAGLVDRQLRLINGGAFIFLA